MGHADDDLARTVAASALDHVVHQRDQAVAAFQRESLLAHVFGVQVLLQTLGGDQVLEQPDALVNRQVDLPPRGLQPLLDPALLLGPGDVHVLGADGAGVDLAYRVQDLAQRHLRVHLQRAGVEHHVHVSLGQAVEGGFEVLDGWAFAQRQRIQVGRLVAAGAEGVDDA